MRNYYIALACLVYVAVPFSVFASNVVINEVLFDPAGDDRGNEWVELYNSSDKDVNISGWELYPDGTGYVTIPHGFSIAAKKFMLIHLRSLGSNSSLDIYQKSTSSNMGNTSGSVALFNAEPRGKNTIKSFMQWGRAGETWESSAADAGIWEKGTFINLNAFAEGNSLALQQDGISSGGKNAWHIVNIPTPKMANKETATPSISIPPISSSLPPTPITILSSSSFPSPIVRPPEVISNLAAGTDVISDVKGIAEKQGPVIVPQAEMTSASPVPSLGSEIKQKEFASSGFIPRFFSFHFFIALAVSIGGALGFLVIKHFS